MKHIEKNGVHTIEYDCECPTCEGSGLFVGLAERDGAAVVCNLCRGTGKRHTKIIWKDFTGKKPKLGVKRVFATNPGICIGENKKKRLLLTHFGGLSYEEWLRGDEFTPGTEDRQHTCPAWWYQLADYDKKPNWKECNSLGRTFPHCSSFRNKEKCWARWDRENA